MFKNILRSGRLLRNYWKITVIVLLMSFLRFPVYAEPLTERQTILSEGETLFYTSSEVDTLIDDLTEAANEAIKRAAGEAARAAFMTSVEREAEALREALRWRNEAETIRMAGIRNNFLIYAICFAGGLVVGVTGTLIIRGK